MNESRESDAVAGLIAKWRTEYADHPPHDPFRTRTKRMADELEAAMQAQQGAEPVGFVLVPREPTEMMKSRGAYVVSGVTREGAAATWAAMVAEALTGAPR